MQENANAFHQITDYLVKTYPNCTRNQARDVAELLDPDDDAQPNHELLQELWLQGGKFAPEYLNKFRADHRLRSSEAYAELTHFLDRNSAGDHWFYAALNMFSPLNSVEIGHIHRIQLYNDSISPVLSIDTLPWSTICLSDGQNMVFNYGLLEDTGMRIQGRFKVMAYDKLLFTLDGTYQIYKADNRLIAFIGG